MLERKLDITKINGGRYGLRVMNPPAQSVTITRSGREWVHFYDTMGTPGVNLHAALADMAEELAELRAFKKAVVTLAVCSLPAGRLVEFMTREDADEGYDENPKYQDAYDLIAEVVEPIVRAEDEARDDGELRAEIDGTGED